MSVMLRSLFAICLVVLGGGTAAAQYVDEEMRTLVASEGGSVRATLPCEASRVQRTVVGESFTAICRGPTFWYVFAVSQSTGDAVRPFDQMAAEYRESSLIVDFREVVIDGRRTFVAFDTPESGGGTVKVTELSDNSVASLRVFGQPLTIPGRLDIERGASFLDSLEIER